jgi:hypothetical protein
MELRFYMDADTGLPHISGHGVSETEVQEVFRNSAHDVSGRENSRIKIGQTDAGRYLQIIYVPDENLFGAFVITAYDLKGKAKDAYKRRRRRRGL